MNIFILDLDPKKCAEYTQDVHIVKMPLETAQMLCSAYPEGKAPYRKTHYNHPCTVWSRKTAANYDWLINLGYALCDEFEYRNGKVHACRKVIEWCDNNKADLYLPQEGLTRFAQAMPDKYKQLDAVKAYREMYIGEKQGHTRGSQWIPAKYTSRSRPEWFLERG